VLLLDSLSLGREGWAGATFDLTNATEEREPPSDIPLRGLSTAELWEIDPGRCTTPGHACRTYKGSGAPVIDRCG